MALLYSFIAVDPPLTSKQNYLQNEDVSDLFEIKLCN